MDTTSSAKKPQQDVTGRDRLVSNVLFSWGSHLVFIVAGFVMPRLIDDHLGQDLLGIWDFAWSLVGYFNLIQGGVNSSVNRYVAKYHAVDDLDGINDILSSGTCVLSVAGLLVLGLTVGVSLLMPQWFGERLAGHVREAQWVFLYLGISLAFDMALGPFGGVLTGFHRWELHNLIKSGWYVVSVAGMIVVLLSGGNIVQMAATYLAGQMCSYAHRMICACRVCPGLRVNPLKARKATIKSMYAFGGKTLIPGASIMFAQQTTSVLIVAHLGPAALALFTRPRSLTQQISTVVNKMAFVLTPTASSMQSQNDSQAIKSLLLKAAAYSCYMSLPLVLVLTVFGGPILRLWMGESYVDEWLPAILALGALPTMVNMPLRSILVGVNAHGRPGLAQFVAAVCSVGLVALFLGVFDWGLRAVALGVAVPMALVNLIYLPYYICRQLDFRMRDYVTSAILRPSLHVLPFAACLLGARFLWKADPRVEFAWGMAIGSPILSVIYWRSVLPDRLKVRLVRMIPAYRPSA